VQMRAHGCTWVHMGVLWLMAPLPLCLQLEVLAPHRPPGQWQPLHLTTTHLSHHALLPCRLCLPHDEEVLRCCEVHTPSRQLPYYLPFICTYGTGCLVSYPGGSLGFVGIAASGCINLFTIRTMAACLPLHACHEAPLSSIHWPLL
jgi:hypothetical protein